VKGSNFITFALLAILLGCFPRYKESSSDVFFLDFEKSSSTKASEIFSEVNYLLLEEDTDLPLVRPYKIVVQDSLIFVEDKELNNLFVFDLSGEIKTVFKSLGKGPNEFTQIDEFSVSEDRVYIQDDYLKKTLIYDFNGHLLAEKYHDFFGFNKYYWFGYDFTYFDSYELHGTDFRVSKGDSILSLFDINRLDKSLPPVSHQYGFVPDFSRKEISFVVPYSYKVALFNLCDFKQRYISFDFGKFNFPREQHIAFLRDQWANKDVFVNNKYVSMLGYFGPLKDNYLLSVSHGLGDPHWFVMDEDMHVQTQFRLRDVENDIDGWALNSPIAWTVEDYVVTKINSNDFYNRVQKTITSGTNINGNLKEFWKEHSEELLDDRLLLVFLKVKDI
jgi:hypothetical protein